MKFFIFHGSFGSPEGNWFPELKEKLEGLAQDVFVPRFPVDDWDKITEAGPKVSSKNQNLKNWLKTFEKEVYPEIKRSKKISFVGHSLAPLFILHVVEKYDIKLDSCIFVSPFLTKLDCEWQINTVNKTFYKSDFDWKKLKKLIPISYILYSDNDPYVDKKFSIQFAQKLGGSLIQVKGAGHMNLRVNLNKFPLVFELCKSRLHLNLYQKYLAHRKELFAVDYVKGRHEEEVIYIKPDEVFDEGVFKFRNLRKEGFCTFYTGISFWDTQSVYYEESRSAAKRLQGHFTRVFVIDKITDLKRRRLLKHIKLDLEAGIDVFLILWKDIEDIGCPADFGIWDNDYLCVVKIGKNKKPVGVRLSSRKNDISNGNKWKRKILEKAVRIHDADKDVKDFISQKQKSI